MADEKEIENGERLSGLETEVHGINKTVNDFKTEFKETIKLLFTKLDNSAPKPISPMMYLGGGVSLITIFGGMFASVLYIANSANAPVIAQLNQVINSVNQTSVNVASNSSQIQLTNQSLAGLSSRANDNKKTIDWFIRDKNYPELITGNGKDIEYLKRDVNQLMENVHKK